MIISKTPVRISFVGGGTDLPCFYEKHGGACVNAAINKYVYVIVNKSWERVTAHSNMFINAAMKFVGIEDVDVTIVSDIPAQGTGLGSSGSLLVGLLHALYAYKGVITILPQFLAESAFKIETEKLGLPVGKQDQYIAAYGGLRYWEFHQDGTVTSELLDKGDLDSKLMLFYLGQTRASASILTEQVANVEKIINNLILVRNYAKHLKNNMIECGEVMAMGWEFKKHFAGNITTPEIDALYQKALEAGVTGGKVVGAGGGGFLLLYVPEHKQEQVSNALGLKRLDFVIEYDGSRIIYNGR